MITNTVFVALLVGTALAVPVPQEEPDYRSRLPVDRHPFSRKQEASRIPTEALPESQEEPDYRSRLPVDRHPFSRKQEASRIPTQALPESQEEPDYRSRLPVDRHPFSRKQEASRLPAEVPEDIFNKLQDNDVKQQLENAIHFLQNNEDLLKYADKADAEDIFQGIDGIMKKVMNAAKETISEEHKSIRDSAVSLTDAGKQIWQTGTQLGKTGVDLTLMIPKFGFNVLRQGRNNF